MAPKITLEGPEADWDGLREMEARDHLAEAEVEKLIPLVSEWHPPEQDGEDATDKLRLMFSLASRCLRHVDEAFKVEKAERALEEQAAKEKTKELKKQIKKMKTRKTDDNEAWEDLRRVEEELQIAEKEIQELEAELGQERTLREEMESKLRRSTDENVDLKREADGLRDEIRSLKGPGPVTFGGGGTSGPAGGRGTGSGPDSLNGGGGDSAIGGDAVDERRMRELEENIRMKNRQIHQLIDDIEEIEKNSEVYQNTVIDLRNRLEEATKQINSMAGEYDVMRDAAVAHDSVVKELRTETQRLKVLLEEEHQDKRRRDEKMEAFGSQVEAQLTDFRNTIKMKEAEIEELKSRAALGGRSSASRGDSYDSELQPHQRQTVSILTQAISERDDQIEDLQEKLAEASREMEASATLIEKLKDPKGKVDPMHKSMLQVRADLHKAEQRIKDLEYDVKEAAEEAYDKAEDLSEAITKLRAYEKGEYGLEQAVNECEALRRQLKIRDSHMEELIQESNSLQFRCGQLQELNESLREKLGLDHDDEPENEGEGSGFRGGDSKKQRDKALLQILHREIERLEEERIQLKTENRSLAKQLGHRAAELGLDAEDLKAVQEYTQALKQRRAGLLVSPDALIRPLPEATATVPQFHPSGTNEERLKVAELKHDVSEYKKKYQELMEENDKLRQGMQEILDSLRATDGQSDVKVESEALEHIMTVLDARHLWGEYHPAMTLKARIEKLEGVNAELRDQIRRGRQEEDRALAHLQRVKTRNEELEAELNLFKEEGIVVEQHLPSILQQPPSLGNTPAAKKGSGASLSGLVIPRPSTSSMQSPGGGGGFVSGDHVGKLNMQLIQVLHQLHEKEESNKKLTQEVDKLQLKFGVVRHQMGLLYEEFGTERHTWMEERGAFKEENALLEEKIQSLRIKLEEYEGHLKAITDGKEASLSKLSESCRQVALLRSNEFILLRRYRAVEESEARLRKDCKRLGEEVVAAENAIIEKMGLLQRHKDMSAFRLESLERQLSVSVPTADLDAADRAYAELTANYRELLGREQGTGAAERRAAEAEAAATAARSERQALAAALEDSRQRVISLEATVTTASSGGGDDSVQTLCKQIATLELRELNEKQRADHADSRLKLAQEHLAQVETRNQELEMKFSEVTRSNLQLQRTERDLRDQLVTSVPRADFDLLQKRIQELESSENSFMLEVDKLREVSDVARNQIELLESRKHTEDLELEGLRKAMLDLQSQNDHNEMAGRLHKQIITLQIREKDQVQRIGLLESRSSRLEAQLFRANRRANERELESARVRARVQIRARTLAKALRDLRRQYAGSIPLAKQEKATKLLTELREEREEAWRLRKEAEVRASEAEQRAEELALKQEGVDELLQTLKQGTGTKQVLEWQKRMEDLRLRDSKARRNAEQWQREVEHLRELTREQASKIDQLEEELTRTESIMEKRQLDWESKEVELEAIDDADDDFIDRSKEKKGPAENRDALKMPDPDLPLARQLEQAFDIIRSNSQTVESHKAKLTESKKINEDLQRRLRDHEAMAAAKDRIINDLRMQVPASVDRAVAAATIGGGSAGLSLALTEDYESKQALGIAQATVTSLRERLAQKEETLTRYEALLKEVKEDHEKEIRQRQDEITALQISVKNQSQAFIELRSATAGGRWELHESSKDASSFSASQANRIHSLEEEIQELQCSLTELSNQLAVTRSEADKNLRMANARQREVEEVRESLSVEMQVQHHHHKQELDKRKNELNVLKQENLMLQEDIQNLKDSQDNTPSSILKTLVDKLKRDLADKESKMKVMGKAITDLKNELVTQTEKSPLSPTSKEGKLVDEKAALKKKVDTLVARNSRLQKQVRNLQSGEASYYGQIKALKEELSQKGLMLIKMKEDPAGSRTASSSLTRVRFASGSLMDEKEKEGLENTLKNLEQNLKTVNQAEKPLEESEVKIPKTNKGAEEVARWEEKKKWEQKVQSLKTRLAEANEQVGKVSGINQSLRDTMSKVEREKIALENKAKALQKASATKNEKLEDMEKTTERLKTELESLKHESVMAGEQGLETLKLRNKVLAKKVEDLERKVSILEMAKKAGGGAMGAIRELELSSKREKEMEKRLERLEEENRNLTCEVRLSSPRFKECQEVLQKILKASEPGQELADDVTRAMTLLSMMREEGQKRSKEELALTECVPKALKTKDTKAMIAEVQRLKGMNEVLITKVEAKEKRVRQLDEQLKELKKKAGGSTSSRTTDDTSGPSKASQQPSRYTLEQTRQLEEDVKRKSDLLAEVKTLLKKAAEREKSQLEENAELKKQVRALVDVNPRSPAELLAKQLRETRLTIQRLENDNKELQQKLSEKLKA